MWFLHKKIILTKYNIAKCNWSGCKKYAFGDSAIYPSHVPLLLLFGEWCTLLFNIPPPTSSTYMSKNWLNGVEKQIKARILVGMCALV
jgi:hypothetical protein